MAQLPTVTDLLTTAVQRITNPRSQRPNRSITVREKRNNNGK